MRGFILTIDALFCLALMVVLSTTVFMYSQQKTSDSMLPQLNQLGRDYLQLSSRAAVTMAQYNAVFKNKTGIGFVDAEPVSPSRQMVHAAMYAYPAVCGVVNGTPGAATTVSLAKNDPCLNESDLDAYASGELVKTEVWVVLPQ